MAGKELYMRTDGEKDLYIKTGLDPWDTCMGGLKKGSLFLLGSRPSHGKTIFSLNIACQSTLNGPYNTLFFSLEMDKGRIYQRLYAIANNTPYKQCPTDKNLLERDFKPKAALVIDDKPMPNVEEICTRADQMAEELKTQGKQLDLMIVDYLELMRPSDPTLSLGDSFKQKLQRLKVLAQKLNIAILVLSQVSRSTTPYGIQEDLPDLSGFRNMDDETFELVDGLGMLYRPLQTTEALLIVKKSPSGFKDKIPLSFDKDTFIFSAEGI